MTRIHLFLLGAALLFAATTGAAKSADYGTPSGRREHPRIIYGADRDATFEFGEFRPLRRSAASSRQAYFGSGEAYDSALAELHAQLEALKARYRLEALALTPAQDAAKGRLPPALVRALLLARQARHAAAD